MDLFELRYRMSEFYLGIYQNIRKPRRYMNSKEVNKK